MTAIALPAPRRSAPSKADFELSLTVRLAIGITAFTLCFLCVVALGRAALGMVENLHYYDKLPVIVHVSAVLPAIPLGGYLLLARKGTRRHKQLGKLWLVLMLVTATSAIFIQSSGGFSPIHILIPVTFHAAWKTVATARKGDIAGHKKHLVFTYFAALAVPGILAFAFDGRLMNVMLLG